MAIKEALVLIAPDFAKLFQIFSFASHHTSVDVLLQNNSQGHEQPIAFFSKSLQAKALKYDVVEKKAYALVKVVKTLSSHLVGS